MRFYFLILMALILSVSACKVSDDASDPTLARVENSELKLSEMRKDETWDSLSQDEKFLRVESWLSRASIYEQALAEGVDKLPEVQNLLEDAKKKIVLDAFFARAVDTISLTTAEAIDFYEQNPEYFLLDSSIYNLAVVTYASGQTAWQYYGPASRKTIAEAPHKNWLLRDVEIFDSTKTLPLDFPRVDLETLSVGKITPPKTCGKNLKSVIVLSKIASGSVRPFADVAELAQTLAANEKRKKSIASLKNEIKKRQAIFVYPEEIAKTVSED